MELPHNPAANADFGWLQALASALGRRPALQPARPLLLPAPATTPRQCCA